MLDAILKFAVGNRWLVVLVALVAALVGGWSFTRLPIDAVPDITNNQVTINTEARALSPLEVEKQVTFPVETALAGIPGLESTRSISRNGFSQVTAIFGEKVDIYFARQQVGERLREAAESLPEGVEPVMGAISTGLGEVFMYTVEFSSDATYVTPEGEVLDDAVKKATYLRTVQDWIIKPQLRNVKGVAGVEAIGGYEQQYFVQPDVAKLMAYGLSFSDLIEALEKNNVSSGAGFIERNGEAYNVRVSGRISGEGEIRETVVTTRGGVPILVKDVASVGGGRQLRTGSATSGGKETVVATALMLIGENSREVAQAVGKKLEAIKASLPAGVVVRPVLDRTGLVNETIGTVEKNLMEGAFLVVAVLFLMLGNIRAAIITSLAIPLSMLLTATGMVETRVSANLVSLGAIDFGIIIDGAVVIVENCLRLLAERQHALGRVLTRNERLAAVYQGARQVVRPSVFGQLIICTVYLPMLTLTGVEGKMFRPMAATVLFALIGALVLSLTLIPALVAIGIRGKVKEGDVFFVRWLKAGYEPLVGVALKLRWVAVLAGIAAFAGAGWLFTRLGQEFIPQLDEGNLAMHAMRIPSTGIEQSTAMQLEVERVVSSFPEVAVVFSKTGTAEMATDPMPPSVSDTFIILKPMKEWRSEAEMDRLIAEKSKGMEEEHHDHGHGEEGEHDEHDHGPPPTGRKGKLIQLFEAALREVPGNNYEFSQPIQMRFNELIAGVRGDVAVKVYGDDFEKMGETAQAVLEKLKETPGAADAKAEQTEGLPMMTVTLDRAALSRYGLKASEVEDVVSVAIGGREAGHVFVGDRRIEVMVRLTEEERVDLEKLRELPVTLPADEHVSTGGAAFVPLHEVARIEMAEGPNQISRENGKRVVTVQCNVRGRDLGTFVEDAQARVASVPLPAGSFLGWGGQFANLQAAKARLLVVVPMCFAVIFMLLLGTFGTIRHAALVFCCVPLALTGGVVTLWLRGMPFSISAAVGFIALSGVSILNGLVMVSLINELRRGGLGLDEAIVRGCVTRLRPVLMTALVAALGFIPMAIATGRGAEVQRPLATVVIGGIVSATLLTLVVLPAAYRILERRFVLGSGAEEEVRWEEG